MHGVRFGLTATMAACENLHRPTLDVLAYSAQFFAEDSDRLTEHLNVLVSPFTMHRGDTKLRKKHGAC